MMNRRDLGNGGNQLAGFAIWLVWGMAAPMVFAQASSTSTSTSSSSTTTIQQAITQINSLLSPQGKILSGNESNKVMVVDYPYNLKRIEEYLAAVDSPPPQVAIEARVVEVKLQGEHALGINWTLFGARPMPKGVSLGQLTLTTPVTASLPFKPTFYPPLGTTGSETPFSMTIFDDNINVILQTLANELKTNLLSAPRITTVNNEQAQIQVIRRVPWAEPTVSSTDQGISITWKINFEEVGITLRARPTINEDGNTISMTLAPEVSEQVSNFPLTVVAGTTSITYNIPVIDRRSASTKVVIGNRQTLIIGGLIKDNHVYGMTKVPGVGDMPIVGNLFRSSKDTTDKDELLIFVSPTIITPQELIHHTQEERFGLGRDAYLSRAHQQRKTNALAEQADAKRDIAQDQAILGTQRQITIRTKDQRSLEVFLQELQGQQQALSGERKALEESIKTEETKVNKLQGTQQTLLQQRKQQEDTLPRTQPLLTR